MNISIGNDHAGVDYKNYIIKNLEEKYNIVNHGTDDENSVDYPDFAHPVSLDVDNRERDLGIVICVELIWNCLVIIHCSTTLLFQLSL